MDFGCCGLHWFLTLSYSGQHYLFIPWFHLLLLLCFTFFIFFLLIFFKWKVHTQRYLICFPVVKGSNYCPVLLSLKCTFTSKEPLCSPPLLTSYFGPPPPSLLTWARMILTPAASRVNLIRYPRRHQLYTHGLEEDVPGSTSSGSWLPEPGRDGQLPIMLEKKMVMGQHWICCV